MRALGHTIAAALVGAAAAIIAIVIADAWFER